MSNDWDEIRRRREREDRESEEEQGLAKSSKPGLGGLERKPESAGEQLPELLTRADQMIDQVNNLYLQFQAGIERQPPVERRKQLEQLMAQIQASAGASPALKFRLSQLVARFIAHRERWDRLLKDIESGKIKRPAGPR